MKGFRWHIVCGLLLLLHTAVAAQILSPVQWSGITDGDSIRLTAVVDEGWHMTLISVDDETAGSEHEGVFVLTLPKPDDGGGVEVRYNACDDQQCTAPETYVYNLDSPEKQTAETPETDNGGSLWRIFLIGLLGGLLAVFTPCVWPVIPMTVSFFLKRGSGIKDALLYGLSIVVIYVGLGLVVTVAFGASALNALSTNAVLNLFFFALFVTFALSFFGLFEIRLPSSWSTQTDALARSASGWASILMMAFTLVIVSFSCTGPIIGTLLVEAAGRSLFAPAAGMLGFALALALPFSLFALFPEWMQRMPHSGEWMTGFKVTLAFAELALSLKFLSVADMAYGWGILPRRLFLVLWIMCFAGTGIYLAIRMIRLLPELRHESRQHGWLRARFVIAGTISVLSLAFAGYLMSGLWGGDVRLVAAFAPPKPVDEETVFHDWEAGMAYARQERRPVLLQFSGYGCVNCRKMEVYVLADERVQEALRNYVCITLMVDSRQDENHNGVPDGEEYSRLQRDLFKANAQPYFVQLSANGEPQSEAFAFSTDAEAFLEWLGTTRQP
jgi:thiol:disulfide interchange protein DsbD